MTAEELTEHRRGVLATFTPVAIVFAAELPRNPVSKVDCKRLRVRAAHA